MRIVGTKGARFVAGLGVLLAGTVTAGSSLTWTWENPQPGPGFFEVLLSGGGSYVAAGGQGLIYLSTDGTHWSSETNPLGSSATSFGGIYAAGVFVLETSYGGNVHLLTSSDGINWTDAINWTVSASGRPYLAYANGTFIALDGTQTGTSSDGVTWALNTNNLSAQDAGNLIGLANSSGQFLAITSTTVGIATPAFSSTDGVNWTALSTPPVPPVGELMGESIYNNGVSFFAVLVSRTSNNPPVGAPTYTYYTNVFTSTDAVHWVQRAFSGSPPSTFENVGWYGSQFVEVGSQVLSDDLTFHTFSSPDGLTWTDLGRESDNPNAEVIAGQLSPVTTVSMGAGYLTVDAGSPLRIYQSSDLLNWTLNFSATSSPVNDIASVAYLNGQYIGVAGGIDGDPNAADFAIVQSSDGVTWNGVYQGSGLAPGTSYMPTVVFGNGVYVATDGDYWVSSPDGLSWTPIAHPPTQGTLISPLVFANGRFAGFIGTGGATGLQGYSSVQSITSTDGVTWTSQYLGGALLDGAIDNVTRMGRTNIASTGGTFISLAADATVYSSTDGLNWTAGKSFPIQNGPAGYMDIYPTAGGYIAVGIVYEQCTDLECDSVVGPYTAIATSADGSTWTSAALSIALSNQPTAIMSVGNGYVSLGAPYAFTLLYGKDAEHWCSIGQLPAAFFSRYSSIAPTGTGFLLAGSDGSVISTTATEADLASACTGTVSSVIDLPPVSSGSGAGGGGTSGGGGGSSAKPAASSGGGGEFGLLTLMGLLVISHLRMKRKGDRVLT